MNNIEGLGLYLKQLREERKIPVAQIAQALKTRSETIQAIEANDFQKIPAPTYVKGYLRSYAGYLGIDSEPILMEYNKQYPPPAKQILVPPEQIIPRVGLDIKSAIKSKLFITAVSIIIFLIILTISMIHIFHKRHAVKIIKEKEAPVQAAQSRQPKEPEKTPAASPLINTPISTPITLSAHPSDSVWLRVASDNKVIFEGILQKNQKESWQAQAEFKLRIGNPSKINLVLNNQPIGSIAPYGPVNVTINEKGIKVEK